MIIHDPKNAQKIESVWAFISQDEDGMEGIIGAPIGGSNTLIPLLGSDEKLLETLKPVAAYIATLTKKKIHLIKFHQREDCGEIRGQ